MTDETTEPTPQDAPDPVGGAQSEEAIVYKESPTAHDELRHSVHLHLTIMNGPTQQLAVFLAKILEFIPNSETPFDQATTDADMKVLAFSIVEALALHIQRSVDDRAIRAQQQGGVFPLSVRQKGDEILVVIGRNRSSENQIAAKDAVLKAIADALNALASVTKAKYPDIRTARGVVL